MGGYGGIQGAEKEKNQPYETTKGEAVKDPNAIEVAEYYINEGKYVAFLHENPPHNRADLSVEGHHVEVKGLTTLNPDTIDKRLKEAFIQIHGDDYRYEPDTYRSGKVILLSRHDKSISEEQIYNAMYKGYEITKRKGLVTGELEFWIRGKIYVIEKIEENK